MRQIKMQAVNVNEWRTCNDNNTRHNDIVDIDLVGTVGGITIDTYYKRIRVEAPYPKYAKRARQLAKILKEHMIKADWKIDIKDIRQIVTNFNGKIRNLQW